MKFVKLTEYENIDPVKTEFNIINNLKKENLDSNYIIADCNFAYLINKKSLQETQSIIDQYLKYKNIIFICQHISAIKLNWGHGVVFSPHASFQDNFIPIPHYAINYNKDTLDFKDRLYDYSFIGSFNTHLSRKLIYEVYKDKSNFLIRDTGEWHFLNQENIKERESFYINSLKNSRYVLCPRGTGPGSIRLWEVLASKCVPILISNELKIPNDLLSNLITIRQYQDIVLIDDIIKENKSINREALFKTYESLYDNRNMHKIILNYIRKTII